MEIGKYSVAADALGFALAAPEGIGRSFNAPHCCGEAKLRRVDDVGFVDAIVSELLVGEHTDQGGPRFLASALFASGFSNGGFLTSHLADKSKHAWAGIAPTAGHEYYLSRTTPLPISMHHCANDLAVNSSGCCMAPAAANGPFFSGAAEGGLQPTCCCEIVAKSCVSTHSLFDRWLTVNQCNKFVASRIVPAHKSQIPDAICTAGVNCAAETMLCIHTSCQQHAEWSRAFPAVEGVLGFFARQVCERHGGGHNAERGASHCLHEHAGRTRSPKRRMSWARRPKRSSEPVTSAASRGRATQSTVRHFLVLVASVFLFPTCLTLCAILSMIRQATRLLGSLLSFAQNTRASSTKTPPPIVVLLPAFNVAATINRALDSAVADLLVALVVVVVGPGCTDATAETAHAYSLQHKEKVIVVEAASEVGGRANCSNLAACVAAEALSARGRGAAHGEDELLVFLHADTVLPAGFGLSVVEALADGTCAVGAFRIWTKGIRDAKSWRVRLAATFANVLNNVRSRLMETPYGDQALFCRRSTFEAVGGFPSVPLMEDSGFVWLARQRGTVRISDLSVTSFASPQWARFGIVYMMRNYLFLSLWMLGVVTPATLHSFYYAGRPLPKRLLYEEMARSRRWVVLLTHVSGRAVVTVDVSASMAALTN